MSNFAVIMDMDKTVVPTWEFMSDVAQALEMGFGVDQRQFYGQVERRHITGQDNFRHYDFFEHVRSLGLNEDEVENYIIKTFSGRDYVYDDVPQFLDFLLSEVRPNLVALLTYGEHRFQRLKYQCSPGLGTLVCIDILEPKGSYLEKHFANYRGVIIDDKPITALPVNFKGVLLERGTADPQRYGSLTQVQQRWLEIVDVTLSDTTMPP